MAEHLYIVTYDVSDPKRWRSVFYLMQGYGEWVQLSVFQCRLTRSRRAQLRSELNALLHQAEDHLLLIDLGPAKRVKARIESLGKRSFQPIERQPVIV